jgi:O-antigen/teichoic acid export membrane protein
MRRALATSFLASCGIQALNVATGVILARTLGPSGRGQLAALLLWPILITSIGALGASEALTYFAAANRRALPDLVGASRRLWVVQSVVCAAATLGVTWSLVTRWDASHVYVLLAAAIVPLYLGTNYALALVQGMQAFTAFNVVRVMVPAITAVGLGSGAAAGSLNVGTALAIYVGTQGVTAIVAAVVVNSRRVGRGGAGSGWVRRVLAYGVRSHVSFVATTVNERLDQTVIALFLAPALLGLYVVAGTLTSLTMLVASTLSLVALPSIATQEVGLLRDCAIIRLVRSMVAVAVAASALVFALVPFLIHTLFGSAFDGAARVARILLVAAIFLATSRLLAAVLRGMNEPLRAGIGDAVGVAVTLVALPVLLPFWGLTGAAVASLAAYCASALWMSRQVRRALSTPRPLLFPEHVQVAAAIEYLRNRASALGRAGA